MRDQEGRRDAQKGTAWPAFFLPIGFDVNWVAPARSASLEYHHYLAEPEGLAHTC